MVESATDKFARASSEMGGLAARLAELRTERAMAIDEMRAEGLSWANIEEITGLTRQRLWKIGKEEGIAFSERETSLRTPRAPA